MHINYFSMNNTEICTLTVLVSLYCPIHLSIPTPKNLPGSSMVIVRVTNVSRLEAMMIRYDGTVYVVELKVLLKCFSEGNLASPIIFETEQSVAAWCMGTKRRLGKFGLDLQSSNLTLHFYSVTWYHRYNLN